MDPEAYGTRFTQVALSQGLSASDIAKCLPYAEGLMRRGLPVIYDCYHFSRLVGYSVNYLFSAANAPENFYRHFVIKKRNGGTREISDPLPSLKEIQRWILDNILSKVELSAYAKAFRPGYSIVDNAKFHLRQDSVVMFDLKDFFPSIKFHRVYVQFKSLGYHRSLSFLLAKICCLKDSLPQGAPTSPALSNMVAGRMDRRIAGYAKKRNIRYTRYADDLAFSNVADIGGLRLFVRSCIATEGFELNETKTRVLRKNNRQLVTGIVVNKKLSPPRADVREMRKVMYFIRKFGLDAHQKHIEDKEPWLLSRIEGKIRFFGMVGLAKPTLEKWLKIVKHARRGMG